MSNDNTNLNTMLDTWNSLIHNNNRTIIGIFNEITRRSSRIENSFLSLIQMEMRYLHERSTNINNNIIRNIRANLVNK